MRRRAFTLIELVSSLFISSVVIVAMASSIGLMTRSLPDASNPTQVGIFVQRALDLIATDARFAIELTIVDDGEINILIPDRDGDSAPDLIVYRWGGSAGDPLTREHKSLGEAPVLTAADEVHFEWVNFSGLAEPSHKYLMATIRVGTTEMAIGQRCLNLLEEE